MITFGITIATLAGFIAGAFWGAKRERTARRYDCRFLRPSRIQVDPNMVNESRFPMDREASL